MIKKYNVWLIALILLAIVGAVIFCPVKMSSGKTCLFHRFLSDSSPSIHMHHSPGEHAHTMEQSYVFPFGLIWWSSLAILFAAIYLFKNKRQY
ncbi:hypothetical protein JW960_08920 [candidate division KSB1 bacterium]|nr:hypothetical protein [candidate division KSB1 bacterium]